MFVVVVLLFGLADAVYFSMTNIRASIPGDKAKLLGAEHPLVTLRAHNGNGLKYSIADNKHMRVTDKGEVLFTENFLLGRDLKDLDRIKTSVTVKDNIGGQDQTSLQVTVSQLAPLDCDYIVQDLCYWQSVDYRLEENSPPIFVGSLASPYLAEMCTGFKINYTLDENDDFQLVPAGRSWLIRSKKPLDRDSGAHSSRPLNITCYVENAKSTLRDVSRTVQIGIVDVDDNAPVAQEAEIRVTMASNVVLKGQAVAHPYLIFHDRDSPEVNTYEATILGDNLDILRPHCSKHRDDRKGPPRTAVSCKLNFTKDMEIRGKIYSVVLQLNDTSLIDGHKTVQVPIHLQFHKPPPKFEKPLGLYPRREVKVFRTAAPLARITQPDTSRLPGTKQFTITALAQLKDIFNVTDSGGIVFVHNSTKLRRAPEYLSLNISWIRSNKVEFDEIQVRIVDEPVVTCLNMSDAVMEWEWCANYDNPWDCLSADSCAISTGGASSIAKRKGPERCMWRGDKNPGTNRTHLYATCTPDDATCPDGVCDPLEELYDLICPQDCSRMIMFPSQTNENTNRGIDVGSGVCTCDSISNCSCGPMKKTKKKSRMGKTSTTTSLAPNVDRHVANLTALDKVSAGLELARCGTTCVLGIVAGALFLAGGVAIVVICWHLDRVHKAVRGKFSGGDAHDMAAPLSDYVDRSVPDTLPLNFDMTTSLADTAVLNIINKYAPDPKWEFPRSQLVIEQTLGEGEFGRVLRAKAMNVAGQTGYTTVAVKTLKDDARETELNDLLSEYQLLKEVSHPNVIRLLGVCTAPGGPIYLIIEFAEHGSLRNYLRRSRHLKSETWRLPSSTGLEDGPEVHYDEPNVSQITPKEILSFAWQICKGMAYLSDIKLVHRDLAARNVLLAADKICKISDFGLTRDIYEDDAYFKRSKGRVPVKWMAPESLSDHIYTNKSDVWSFGILVWELVTLGATPYPGIAVQNLFHLLKQGYRMERPDNCSPTLYNIMRSCWHIDSEQRPTFQELSALWEKMLSDEVEYLDLTNNAIHNRSYFCAPFDDNLEKSETSPLNYMSKSQSYIKCGSAPKFQNGPVISEQDKNQNDLNTQGYETPVKVAKKIITPTNDCPQYYTDMQQGKAKI